MIGNEGYLARRLDQIDQDYVRELTGLYFFPVLGNHLYSGEGTDPLLSIVACRNGVVDADTGVFLDADEIQSLHADLTQVLTAPTIGRLLPLSSARRF